MFEQGESPLGLNKCNYGEMGKHPAFHHHFPVQSNVCKQGYSAAVIVALATMEMEMASRFRSKLLLCLYEDSFSKS